MVISDLVAECANLFHLNKTMIVSKTRQRTAVRARQALAMALSIRGHSTSAIGRWLDRDHTTIMHSLDVAKMLMERDSIFGQKVFALAQLVHQPIKPHPQRHKQVAKIDAEAQTVFVPVPKPEEEEERKYSGPQDWGCDAGVPTHNNVRRSLQYASEKLLEAIRREYAVAA